MFDSWITSWRKPALGGDGVTVLYVQPRGGTLSQDLQSVASQYGQRVKLVEVSRLPGSPKRRDRVPRVRVMRGERIISEAMGADLPRRELDRVIRTAFLPTE